MMKFYLENVIAAMCGCWLPTWLEKEHKIY